MKLTGWIFCLELALAGANLFGASLTNHAFALNAPPSASGCAAPIPVDYFESTDQNLVIWVFAQLKTGDAVSISWTTSAKILDSSDGFSPVTSDGGYC